LEEIKEKLRRIGSRLKPMLEKDSGYEFNWHEEEKPILLVSLTRVFNNYDLPTMFQSMELLKYYNIQEIDWTKDLFDKDLYSLNRSVYIDNVEVRENSIAIIISREFYWGFMSLKYYGCELLDPGIILRSRENRMKAAKFIPGIIKDIEMFLKLLYKTLEKYNIDSSEIIWGRNLKTDLEKFRVYLEFSTEGMNEDEIVENTIRRVRALSEYRRKFRAWLASYERREAYDKTRRRRPKHSIFENSFYLCALPPNVELPYIPYDLARLCEVEVFLNPEEMRSYEDRIKREMLEEIYFYEVKNKQVIENEPVIHKTLCPFYNLDGYALKFKGIIKLNEKKEKIIKADGEIIVDKSEVLKPFSLKEIEFLREDFPELFGQ